MLYNIHVHSRFYVQPAVDFIQELKLNLRIYNRLWQVISYASHLSSTDCKFAEYYGTHSLTNAY